MPTAFLCEPIDLATVAHGRAIAELGTRRSAIPPPAANDSIDPMTIRSSGGPPSGDADRPAGVATGDEIDRQLVVRALDGERDAFRSLVERHQARVFALAKSLLRNHADAADIAQEAFVRAYGNLRRYRAEGSFTAWIARITSNLAIDFLRRQKSQASTELSDDLGEPSEGHAGRLASQVPADPQTATLRHELGAKLQKALDRLPEKHRSILIMREIDGLSYQELSDALGIPVGTVMSRLFHSRVKMQEMLREYLEESPAASPAGEDS
jgi:RNA polymerase sigma-70 factor (ECF subfamily)